MKLRGNAAYWNHRSEIFDEKILEIYKEAYKKTIANTKKYMKGTELALDIGCGTGATTIELAERAAQITAIDTSPGMMEQAVAKASQAGLQNIRFLNGDMFLSSLEPESFDVVMAFNVLLYMPDQAAAMKRIWELLRPGGCFLSASDCLKFSLSREALRKWFRSRTGRMPYVEFYSRESLVKRIREQGFQILETEVLFNHPVNLFVAARKN